MEDLYYFWKFLFGKSKVLFSKYLWVICDKFRVKSIRNIEDDLFIVMKYFVEYK